MGIMQFLLRTQIPDAEVTWAIFSFLAMMKENSLH